MELDISLNGVAGEDDSLLQQNPTPDDDKATAAAAASTDFYFSCSPLQLPGSNRNADRSCVSPIMGLRNDVDVEIPTCSSPIGNSNKEIINMNKSELLKLNAEPQQMKRKKRGGAFNLRKSLAWDRAFFTEEGVLNPLELSMLSGNFGNSSGKVPPTIHEEGRKLSAGSGRTSNTKARDNVAPIPTGTPKVLPSPRNNRTGSKSGGCSRPLFCSSLKRPANASTMKSAMKESKLPRVPVSRSGAHSLSNTNKSNVLSTSLSKHNQIDQAADTVQKSAGLQGFSKNIKISASNAKAASDSLSVSTKSSLQHLRSEMANSALEVGSSTNSHPPSASKENFGLKVLPAAVLPHIRLRAPDAHEASRKTGGAHCINGNMRYTKLQTTKPSGLRMPSPSLGFFGQPQLSASNSSYHQATQSSNIPKSCIPCMQRLNASNNVHDPKLLHAPGKMMKMNDNGTVTGNPRVPGLSSEFSVSSGHNNVNFSSQHSHAVPVKVVSKTNDTIKHQQVGDKEYSPLVGAHDVRFKSQSDYAAGHIKQDFPAMHNDSSTDIHDDERSEKKAELIKGDNNKENHDPMRNDGFLLEDRRSFESQKCKSGNAANVNSNICQSNGIEKLTSENPSIESTEQASEGTTVVDLLSNKLQMEDVQTHVFDGTLLAKKCDNNLCTSEVHDQYLAVDDGSRRFGEHPKLKNCHLLVEEPLALNHDFLLDDQLLLSESTPAEESQGDPGVIQDGGAEVHEMVDESLVEVALQNSAVVSLLQNHENYIDTQFKPDISLKKSRDHRAGVLTSCNSSVFCSLSNEEDVGANEFKSDILAEKADTKASQDYLHKENEIMKRDGCILFGESRLLNFHAGDLATTADVNLTNQACGGSELTNCQIASPVESTEQANEGGAQKNKMTNELCVRDEKVQSLDGILLVEGSNSRLSSPVMDSQSPMAISDVIGQSDGQPELQISSLVVDHIFQDDNDLHINDYLLLGKSISSEESQEERVLGNVPVAQEESQEERGLGNVPVVQERSNTGGTEFKSSIVVIHVPMQTQDSGVDMESIAEHQLVGDAPLGSVNTQNSTELDTHFGNDMLFSGQAACSDSISAVLTREDQTSGLITTHKALSSSEESALSVQTIQTLADETNTVDAGVDKTNSMLPDNIEVAISEENISPTGELLHKLDDATCLIEEGDTTMPMKSEDGGMRNLVIKPPVNAVPFSDEWLAAMEAAGEEILTTKSGAVQHSPPDKSQPEPGPWSPVKRQHNQIGPYDCTKFINIPPPLSD